MKSLYRSNPHCGAIQVNPQNFGGDIDYMSNVGEYLKLNKNGLGAFATLLVGLNVGIPNEMEEHDLNAKIGIAMSLFLAFDYYKFVKNKDKYLIKHISLNK